MKKSKVLSIPVDWRKRADEYAANAQETSRQADIITERHSTHGDFTENAYVSQTIKDFLRSRNGWQFLNDVQQESLDMIALKISRIMSGRSTEPDHWDDIIGYARLAKGDQPKKEEPNPLTLAGRRTGKTESTTEMFKALIKEKLHGSETSSAKRNNLDSPRRRKDRRVKGQRSRA